MVRVGVLIGVFVAGGVAALLAIYVALRAAPGTIMADDLVDALSVVAAPSLSRFHSGSAVYVKSSVGPSLLERLHSEHPSLTFRSFSERPEDNGCTGEGGSLPAAPCERDDFVKLEALSAPTPRSMLVAVATSTSFRQVLLLKFRGRWHVVVDRAYAL